MAFWVDLCCHICVLSCFVLSHRALLVVISLLIYYLSRLVEYFVIWNDSLFYQVLQKYLSCLLFYGDVGLIAQFFCGIF